MASVTALDRIGAAQLAALLRRKSALVAVVDVRDDDYIGGHIKDSLNFPSRSLDATMPTLVRKLENKDVVVFHCALSQERGPRAALRYMRAREREGKPAAAGPKALASLGAMATEKPAEKATDEGQVEPTPTKAQEQTVYVLDRGFTGWQQLYGHENDLTEGYRPELWED